MRIEPRPGSGRDAFLRGRSGFSLVELVFTMVLIGALMAVALPRLRNIDTRAAVRGSRTALITAIQRTRTSALSTGRTTTLNISASKVWVTATPRLNGAAGVDTVGVVDNLQSRYGVTVTPDVTITFDGRGIPPSAIASTTIQATKSGVTDSIVISGYGRIVK